MRDDRPRPPSRSHQGVPSPPRATGIVPRRDPRLRPRPTSPRGGWLLGVLGVVIGTVLIGWTLIGGSTAGISTAASSPTVKLTARPTLEVSLLPTATVGSIPTPEPTLGRRAPRSSPTPVPVATPEATLTPTSEPTSTPGPTLEPTAAPTPQLGLIFDFPHDGEVVSVRDINVIGTAPPGSTVTRDIPMWFDDHTTTREDGIWMLPVHLGNGPNLLRLRVGDDRSTEQAITVFYQP